MSCFRIKSFISILFFHRDRKQKEQRNVKKISKYSWRKEIKMTFWGMFSFWYLCFSMTGGLFLFFVHIVKKKDNISLIFFFFSPTTSFKLESSYLVKKNMSIYCAEKLGISLIRYYFVNRQIRCPETLMLFWNKWA